MKLFAPEHGLEGVVQAGIEIEDVIDEATGLQVLSMFKNGSTMDLEGIEVMAYDIQDIGLRFFSHISILALAMKECAKKKIPFVVFDRYNPLGLNRMSGTVLEAQFASIVGMYAVPSQYGLTVGEYACYINEQEKIDCELYVVSCQGLKRSDSFRTLNMPWINLSPNMPTFDTAVTYIGNVLFEGTNVSEGRGTTKPFEFIGAPWINARELAAQMNTKQLAGVRYRPVSFVPTFSKYQGECCNGVQVHITDYDAFDSFFCGLMLFQTIRNTYPQFQITDFLKNLMGTDAFASAIFDPVQFTEEHKQRIAAFTQKAQKYYLY